MASQHATHVRRPLCTKHSLTLGAVSSTAGSSCFRQHTPSERGTLTSIRSHVIVKQKESRPSYIAFVGRGIVRAFVADLVGREQQQCSFSAQHEERRAVEFECGQERRGRRCESTSRACREERDWRSPWGRRELGLRVACQQQRRIVESLDGRQALDTERNCQAEAATS